MNLNQKKCVSVDDHRNPLSRNQQTKQLKEYAIRIHFDT